MKKLLFICLLLSGALALRAQDEAVFTHTFINPFLTNPGVAGMSGDHQIQFHLRNSWSGFTNNPQSYALTWNGPVANNMGLGVVLFTENAGSLTRYRGQLSYGFNFQVAEDFRLGIGLSTEFHQERIPASIRDNPLQDPNDPLIDDRIEGAQWFDASMGLYGTYQDKFYVGLSTTNMVRARLNDLDDDTFAEEIFNHWLFLLGYKFRLAEHDVVLEPTVFLRKARTAPFLADFGFRASFLQERVTGGLIYRAGAGGTLGLIAGTKLKAFRFLYSYDVGFQRFQQYSSGSHELTLGIDLPGRGRQTAAPADQPTDVPVPPAQQR